MPETQFLDIDLKDTVAIVTMNRPPVNAVSLPMYREIREVFGALPEYAPEARAVILTGAGKHFCGGSDLTEFRTMTPLNAGSRMATVREAFAAIYDAPIPVIAAISGVTVGTGVAIAGSCDLVVAAKSARFGLPEIQVGAMGGAKHLSRLVPQGVVRQMHFTADLRSAEELAAYGGIAAIVPDEQLMDAAMELASRITRHSPVAIQAAKRSLNQIEYVDLKTGYQIEQRLTGDLAGTHDAKEAVRAFFEHRDPVYTGH